MVIKSDNQRFSKGMVLTGNVLSGDTFNARDNIKKFWDGKWNSQNKTWTVNPEKVMQTLNSKYNWGLSIGRSSDAQQTIGKTAYNPRNWRNADGSLGEDF